MKLTNVILGKVETKSDHSLKITLFTRDMGNMDASELSDLFANVGKEIEEADIELSEEDAGRSPSMRLRAVLYRTWEQSHKEKYPEFEVYYRAWMERTIEKLKESLN